MKAALCFLFALAGSILAHGQNIPAQVNVRSPIQFQAAALHLLPYSAATVALCVFLSQSGGNMNAQQPLHEN
jgi:hypothetical protein